MIISCFEMSLSQSHRQEPAYTHHRGQQNATFRSLPRIHAAILFFQDIQHQSRIWFRCCYSCYCRSVHGLVTLPSEYIRRQVGGRYAFNLFRVMSLGILQFRSGVDNLYSYIYICIGISSPDGG